MTTPANKLSPVSKWATVGRVLLFCICCTVTLAFTSGITKDINNGFGSYISLLLAILITTVLTLLFVRWEGIKLNDTGIIPGGNSLPRLIIGFLIGFVMAALQPIILILLNSHIHLVLSTDFGFTHVAAAFILYALIAIREEIAFRAYALRSLDRVMKSWIALAVILVIFSLEHILGGMSWAQALFGAGVGSVLFGIASLSTKGLAMPIGLHIAWNFGQWVFGLKDDTGIWRAVIAKGYENEVQQMGFFIYLVIMAMGIWGLYFYWRKRAIAPIGSSI